ncbi:hypothetical protein ACRYCC_10415 [Actinomadura scrupuli]|uniref:hypothetical protein n=1 Tax=Actinomadura scrupuli TaxID=559629 RepID=UPI003D95145B
MTDTPHEPEPDLQEVATRNQAAHEIIAGFQTTSPAEIWRYIETALADVPALVAEVARLRTDLDATRLNRANLAAAALATIAAHHEGEPDPLSYLRDELTAQAHTLRGHG